LKITKPDIDCPLCKKPKAVYNADDLCVDCQAKTQQIMDKRWKGRDDTVIGVFGCPGSVRKTTHHRDFE
jgi:hypothetical protein